MQTAISETESKSRDLSICVHHYILRAPCPKGQEKQLLSANLRRAIVSPTARSVQNRDSPISSDILPFSVVSWGQVAQSRLLSRCSVRFSDNLRRASPPIVRLRAVRAHFVKMGPELNCCRPSWPISKVPASLLHSCSLPVRTLLGVSAILGALLEPLQCGTFGRTAVSTGFTIHDANCISLVVGVGLIAGAHLTKSNANGVFLHVYYTSSHGRRPIVHVLSGVVTGDPTKSQYTSPSECANASPRARCRLA